MPGAVLVACPAGAPSASAESQVVLSPVADTYVRSTYPNTNYADRETLKVDGTPTVHAYLRFDLELPAGASIMGAQLQLYTTSESTLTGYEAYAVSDTSWSESDMTYSNAPSFGAQLGTSGGWSTTGYKSVTLPAGSVHPGLNSLGAGTTAPVSKTFSSREGTHGPQLVVTYTLPGDDHPLLGPRKVVLAAGDIQKSDTFTNVTAALLQENPHDALLTLGDNQYESGLLADYNAFYSMTWGTPFEKPLTYPVPGNHEASSDLGDNYCTYFRVGVNGAAALDPCPGGTAYYSYDLGAWHVVALDSSSGTIGGTQRAWLRSDLAAHPSRCTLAYWHHPRYSGGMHGNHLLDNVWDDLMDAGVDVVLVGHDHDYQRFAPMDNNGNVDTTNGIREFVVGTGGASHYPVSSVPGLEAANDDTFGVLRLTLQPDGYAWKFLPEAGKTFSDSGSDLCH